MLIIDGVKYRLWTPTDEEKDFHPMIRKHSKEIFGENSLYFDVHHKLKYKLESKAGIASLPDAYVITLSKPYRWFVVENELSTHPVYSHMVPQLTKFINGIKNPKSQKQVANLLYNETINDPVQKAYIEKMIASPEIYRFLSNVVSDSPRIAIIVENMTSEIKEACVGLPNVHYIEFKTYVREDAENVRAHLFEPLYSTRQVSEERKRDEIGKRPLPEHYKSWEKMLAWVDDNTRNVVETLTKLILNRFDNVSHRASGRHYMFCKGKLTTKSAFVGFILTKKHLKVRIRTDPRTLRDPNRLLNEKVYAGWFFKQGEAREFKMTDIEQIDAAMKLIKHSYELTK